MDPSRDLALLFVFYIHDLYNAIQNVISRLSNDETALVLYDKFWNVFAELVALAVRKLSS